MRSARPRLEEVLLRPDGPVGGHDDLFPDRVDRGVGHLREQLLEVAVQELGLLGQYRERRVVAHRAHGVRARRGHRRDDHPHVLGGVPEHLLAPEDGLVVGTDHGRGGGQVLEPHERVADPVLVRLRAGDLGLELLVRDDPALRRVDEEHPSGLQAALLDDVAGWDVEHARLGGHDDPAVAGHPVAAGAEPVAVERGADPDAVGEGERRRPVPWFHEARVVLVERPPFGAHRRVPAPRLGDHHHHHVGEAAAGEVEQLEDVVEDLGVGAIDVRPPAGPSGGRPRTPRTGTSTGGRRSSSRSRAAC